MWHPRCHWPETPLSDPPCKQWLAGVGAGARLSLVFYALAWAGCAVVHGWHSGKVSGWGCGSGVRGHT
jgi:hypothetical protein